jgi:hypothetical protein
MTLRLFAAREGSATLWELDDPSVFTDGGAAVSAFLETHPVDFGPAKGYGRLRQFVQWFAQYGTAVATVTPIADGRTLDEQAFTQTLDVSRGLEQRMEVPLSAAGTRFAVRIDVGSVTGLFEVGESDMSYILRRSLTRGG